MKKIKKWLISGTTTAILIVSIIAAFILITIGMKKLELTPIDLTPEKSYTLTDESKEKVKNIDKNINVYLIGFSDGEPSTTIAKQYNKVNDKINVENIDIKKRTDLAQKYGIDSNESRGVIIECGEKFKVLTEQDLVSYDMTTYESTDVTEEKITASILKVTTDKIPNIYFLTGYTDMTLDSTLSLLGIYLENEILNVNKLDLLAKVNVPEDCDTLIITTPNKDFTEVMAESIIKYINKGGNILWLNSSYGIEMKLPNVNKVLAAYGIDPFSVGYTIETSTEKMYAGAPNMIIPETGYSDITSKTSSILLAEPTKLNLKNDDKLKELKIEKEDLLLASETSLFRSDLKSQSLKKIDSDIEGQFVIGAKLTKTINDNTKSTMVIYGDNYFISNAPVEEKNQTPLIMAYDNKDLVLNTIAALTDREEDITVRNKKDDITYTATQKQDNIIRIIIFTVPGLIILIGIIVWTIRRRKK